MSERCTHKNIRSEINGMVLYYCCDCNKLIGGSKLGMDVTKPIDYSTFGEYKKNQ